jgi:glycosyltransferase involved in cell wall biosynthesis
MGVNMTGDTEQPGVDISIVIPIYNEEKNIFSLCESITRVMDGMHLSYEIIAVDDGSNDRTLAELARFKEKNSSLKIVNLRRNFGQTAALSCGFDQAKGGIVVTIDADLQNDPADIPNLVASLSDCDIVSGWRIHRKDEFLTRRLPSFFANHLISWATGVKLHDYGCTLKAYRREVLSHLRLYGQTHRYIPAIASWMGTKVKEIPVRHRPRMHGKSKYGLSRTLRVILDLMVVKFLLGFGTNPIQLFGPIGIFSGAAGFIILVYLSVLRFARHVDVGNRPLLLLGVLLVVVGVQTMVLGLLGEMLVRIYHESQNKPTYIVKKVFT